MKLPALSMLSAGPPTQQVICSLLLCLCAFHPLTVQSQTNLSVAELTIGTNVYRDAVIRKAGKNSVMVRHADGFFSLSSTNLPAPMREQFTDPIEERESPESIRRRAVDQYFSGLETNPYVRVINSVVYDFSGIAQTGNRRAGSMDYYMSKPELMKRHFPTLARRIAPSSAYELSGKVLQVVDEGVYLDTGRENRVLVVNYPGHRTVVDGSRISTFALRVGRHQYKSVLGAVQGCVTPE